MSNSSHTPLEAQLKRLLRDGKPTGEAHLDDLAATLPQADTRFQQELEDTLMAHYEQMMQDTAPFAINLNQSRSKQTEKVSNMPITMIAASFTALLIGGLMMIAGTQNPLTVGNTGQDIAQVATATHTATPIPTLTPTPMHVQPAHSDATPTMIAPTITEANQQQVIPIIIALRDIRSGEVITGDMLTRFYIPIPLTNGDNQDAYLPDDFSGFFQVFEHVIGKTASVNISALSPILGEAVGEETADGNATTITLLSPYDMIISGVITLLAPHEILIREETIHGDGSYITESYATSLNEENISFVEVTIRDGRGIVTLFDPAESLVQTGPIEVDVRYNILATLSTDGLDSREVVIDDVIVHQLQPEGAGSNITLSLPEDSIEAFRIIIETNTPFQLVPVR